MEIPQQKSLTTMAMSRIFTHTTATYKFYWFIGILDLYIRKKRTRINAWDIMIEMVANAWYPACYFHLSFGKSESLYNAITVIQKKRDIPISISPKELSEWLHANINDEFIVSTLRFLLYNVPYRFLSPWIRTDDNDEMVLRSQNFENDCLYKIEKADGNKMWIELNTAWLEYLQTNYKILREFAYWNLALFMQARNPNVPNIPNKLVKPETRNSLTPQHKYWDFVISHGLHLNCIYTGKEIKIGEYDLDHFIPWSFVSHNLVWNLLPAESSINSSKSNKLPELELYLPMLAASQRNAIRVALANNYRGNILEDYLSLGCTPQDIANMDDAHLYECFNRTYSPLCQIAQNMGFEKWKYMKDNEARED